MFRMPLGKACAASLAAFALGSQAFAVDVFINYRQYSGGNWEIDIVSREDRPVSLLRAVANQSNRPECILTPYASEFGAWLARSDASTIGARSGIQITEPLQSIVVERGQVVTATVSRQCGYLLDIRIETDRGDAYFEID
ncbi:hypothetical protein NO932_06560 [Pelagibacterium sp. 26DY04]|uniref:hypothetical protein n=1 Tax=Pelagibacterium sp. 26DY04 TaxID=2967130 RepID=UPI002815DF8B|nr:hypothetical protein [Pelagibacterium sp. 26DY04]WMT88267.1 hypothetical protein NO932_06560 [Pelagibacterium sp. 26DY04]